MNQQDPDAQQAFKPSDCRDASDPCCAGANGTASSDWPRRDFLKVLGLGAASLAALPIPAIAGPFETGDFERLVPADKKLDPLWIKSLFDRGERRIYRDRELEHIGLPIGGVCAGQLYLGGDGRLWLWDIFNDNRQTSWRGDHYAQPLKPLSEIEQGFAVRVETPSGPVERRLDRSGFADIRFQEQYPVGTVEYRDNGLGIQVTLEAFSPFIPLNLDDSSLPATIMSFTLRNTGKEPMDVTLAGWLENAVCRRSPGDVDGQHCNRVVRGDGATLVESSAQAVAQAPRDAKRPDIVFDRFERRTHEGWTATGEAFGVGPVAQADIPAYQGQVGAEGQRLINSHATSPGSDVAAKDSAIGTLTSRPFTIARDYINFLVGGGSHAGKTCVNLIVKEKAVLSATGRNDNRLSPHTWDVRRWSGQTARIQVVDNEKGGWGNVGCDDIVFSDEPRVPAVALADRGDYGTMALALLAAVPGDHAAASAAEFVWAELPAEKLPASVFRSPPPSADDAVLKPLQDRLIGGIGRRVALPAGESTRIRFVIAWHFPNARLPQFKGVVGRHYAGRFATATQVADYIAAEADRLCRQTVLWRDTWYDSTLPHWFLDRAFINTSILATTTCYRFRDGRFYGWEGVGCCPGTCLHVWQYAQAAARIFPELERDTRQRVDFGISFQPNTGIIGYRGPEVAMNGAADGQAGTVLRAYREHQMSPDSAFLRHNWPRVRKSIEWLISLDSDNDGVLDAPQYNTLDDAWHGEIAWISSLYVAALKAGQAMATEMNDEAFAQRAGRLAEAGSLAIARRLFNGEFFIHRGDPKHPNSPGSYGGCEIDQVFGQSWAFQVGLGRILDADKVKTALKSLWRYNFAPDVGPYRNAFPKGRWYALAGEGGLLMCTFPKGDADSLKKGNETFASYFNECMTGFEYQVAAHMLWEDMVIEGLAITRMIHDRYHPLRRNPFNEIECGDHYARAMASFGVYLAACGYEYHGPRGDLAFAPRLTPADFRCAFTAAQGWGTFSQKIRDGQQRAQVTLKWGQLRLARLHLALPPEARPNAAAVSLDGRKLGVALSLSPGRATLAFEETLIVHAGQMLEVLLVLPVPGKSPLEQEPWRLGRPDR